MCKICKFWSFNLFQIPLFSSNPWVGAVFAKLTHSPHQKEWYLPTKSNHLHTNNLNHLEEIKSLRELVSNIKKSLRPNYKIISKLNNHNFVLHDSLLSCGMILGFLQSWDEHKLLTPNQYKHLNILSKYLQVNCCN